MLSLRLVSIQFLFMLPLETPPLHILDVHLIRVGLSEAGDGGIATQIIHQNEISSQHVGKLMKRWN